MTETGKQRLYPGQTVWLAADGPTALARYSFLPLPAKAILKDVARFQMLTSSQIRKLHYPDGSEVGKGVRSRRHLTRLTKLGMLKRFWGVYEVPEYVYVPAASKARAANMHTLDIAELWVQLTQKSLGRDFRDAKDNGIGIIFDPEPWCHVTVGHMVLKPDALAKINEVRYFIEVDRGTEFRSVLAQKMRRYEAARHQWAEPSFPRVVFVVQDADRQRFVENIIKTQVEPRLFVCYLFSEVADRLIEPNRFPVSTQIDDL